MQEVWTNTWRLEHDLARPLSKPPEGPGARQDEALVLSLCSVFLALGRKQDGSPWHASRPGDGALLLLSETIRYCHLRGVSVQVTVDNRNQRK